VAHDWQPGVRGAPTRVVSQARHGHGVTHAQVAVEQQRSRLRARDMADTGIAMHALLTRRSLAGQIIAQSDRSLMMVNANQP
jgi:hypothetical protein